MGPLRFIQEVLPGLFPPPAREAEKIPPNPNKNHLVYDGKSVAPGAGLGYPRPLPTGQAEAGVPSEVVLDIDGTPVALEVRTSPRARRMLLRVDHRREVVVLTLPRFVSHREGLRFARGNTAWISERLAALPPRIPFADGADIPLLGIPHRIRHRPEARGAAWLEGNEIHVAGGAEFLSRRVADFLRRRARHEILSRAEGHAAFVGRTLKGVTLRDTATRWGSCSPTGELSFSWRLVLAPDSVLDYVVAHEIAHLVHFDHGPRFWALLASMIGDVDSPRAWLRDQGAALHRYG